MSVFNKIEEKIVSWEPKKRRRTAVHMFVWSIVMALLNITAYALGWITESQMILLTLTLSWLALTLTAADILATTDVREKEEKGP